MSDHQHGHGCGCGHGAAGLQGEELGLQYSLYQKIDLENVTCLNEAAENSGKLVFKPWEQRKDRDKVKIILPFLCAWKNNKLLISKLELSVAMLP